MRVVVPYALCSLLVPSDGAVLCMYKAMHAMCMYKAMLAYGYKAMLAYGYKAMLAYVYKAMHAHHACKILKGTNTQGSAHHAHKTAKAGDKQGSKPKSCVHCRTGRATMRSQTMQCRTAATRPSFTGATGARRARLGSRTTSRACQCSFLGMGTLQAMCLLSDSLWLVKGRKL